MNDFGLSDESLAKIVKEISSHPEITRAVIFGSRAMGNYKPGSDVDISISGSTKLTGVALEVSAALNERTILPYHFDVVHYESIDNIELKNHIDTFGKIIFEK